MKKLLIFGSDKAVFGILEYAKKNGIYTIVTDSYPVEKSPCKLLADEYWDVHFGDLDTLEKKCNEVQIDGVITGLSEYGIEKMMELSKRLGLKSYCTPEAWHYSKDKDDFKSLCKKLGAPVAKDYYISDELTDDELATIEYPVVVKPVDQNGNRGVSYCYNPKDLREAYHYAKSISKSDKIIIEKMLKGEEWYATYVMADGEASMIALNAMYSEPGEPKNCYTITTTVSDHIERFNEEVNSKMVDVLKAMGCREGLAWIQVMLDEDDHFYILEMGYRLDGDMMYIPYKDLVGYDVIKYLVNYTLGENVEASVLPPSQIAAYDKCACAYMFWANKEGTVKEIKGLDEIQKIPGVSVATVTRPGTTLEKYHSYGNVLFVSKDCEEMCRIIDQINKTVSIINENDEDVIIKYTDFDYLQSIYKRGLSGL